MRCFEFTFSFSFLFCFGVCVLVKFYLFHLIELMDL